MPHTLHARSLQKFHTHDSPLYDNMTASLQIFHTHDSPLCDNMTASRGEDSIIEEMKRAPPSKGYVAFIPLFHINKVNRAHRSFTCLHRLPQNTECTATKTHFTHPFCPVYSATESRRQLYLFVFAPFFIAPLPSSVILTNDLGRVIGRNRIRLSTCSPRGCQTQTHVFSQRGHR